MFGKKKDEMAMEEISRMLEKLLNGEALKVADLTYGDTLPDKIRHQVIRLSEKMKGTEARVGKERDETRKLISEIAHQMRTPLANIESYTLLLAQSANADKRNGCFTALEKAEEKLHFLVENFIKMSRLENGIIQIRKESESLQETILSSVLMVQGGAEQKQIDICLEMDDKVSVWHDFAWLGEAIYNLLDNSVKYSENGSAIQVAVKQDELYTRILVSDQGIGIGKDEEGKIFQRFYRGKDVRRQPGLGLGLYLAREIVTLHGGFMKCKRKEKGLDMCIFLPT
ncbi:MAG: HAMP domain-containing histidine kinase [Ruminococcus sp.]|nr:HAMP domain-containing histidine kinase [Ruminococcus sp.]